ncbi:LADA_0E04896g1_1 [Lachancea dasiensis]|uniref:Oleate activated transcription factor 3 n=1 Tax=Lachancea dasiensis TaxID=1072105 RepID=A0A1G4JBX1_9SACH|nr:LADA_0E04896g1_1 [Lachancea dasiensis]
MVKRAEVGPVLATKKRRRQTLVCTNCRNRKSKCDRGKPACSSCVKAGLESSCYYVTDSKSGMHQEILPNLDDFFPQHENLSIDMVSSGNVIKRKRSGTTYLAPFTVGAAKKRDVYLQILDIVCAPPRRVGKLPKSSSQPDAQPSSVSKKNDGEQSTECLPRSMRHIKQLEEQAVDAESTLTSKHKEMCKHLFDKFGRYRKNRFHSWTDENLPLNSLPDADIFFQSVMPYYVENVSELCPIFDLGHLTSGLESFYLRYINAEPPKKLEVDDYAYYSILLLITCLVHMSISFSSVERSKYSIVKTINTDEFISVANHCIYRHDNLRKCSLIRLQSMMLLRFYQWCAPDDGDGEYLQQSAMLMGMIVAACNSLGIGWHCFQHPTKLVGDINFGPSQSIFSQDPKEYQRLWAVVLHWDRKASLLTGLPCLVNSTMRIPNDGLQHLRLYTAKYDNLMQKLATAISNDPSAVNYDSVMRLSTLLKRTLNVDMKEKETHAALALELTITINLLELSVEHARLINCELSGDPEQFQECMPNLMAAILKIINLCEHYLAHSREYLQSTRFYTNKIVELAFSMVGAILPSIILRSGRSTESNTKKILMQYLESIFSTYFKHWGTEYYESFRRLFGSKIIFKTLSYLNEKDPWETLLEYIVTPVTKQEAFEDNLPYQIQNFKKLYYNQGRPKSASDIWDACYVNKELFAFDIDMDSYGKYMPFFEDCAAHDYDVFASFFNKVSSPFLQEVKNLPSVHNVSPIPSALDNFDYNILSNDETGQYDPLTFLKFFEPEI